VAQDVRPAGRSPSPWPARLALFAAIVVYLATAIAARMLLAPYLLHWVSRLVHGSPTWMFIAGWATIGFAPAAALIFLLDGNRRERQIGDDPLKRAHLARGHAVAGPGSGYWIRRLPLILLLLVAFVFLPSRTGENPIGWHDTLGGEAFRKGWGRSSLVCLLAWVVLLIFRLLAWAPGNSDRLLRVAGPLVAASPVLVLLTLPTTAT
jgi:hypothetical protein